MSYLIKKIYKHNLDEVVNTLSEEFDRKKIFWTRSLGNFKKYLDFSNGNYFGYGLYYNQKLCGILLTIHDARELSVSISSLMVKKEHRNQSLFFLKDVLSRYEHKIILDFTATERVKKVLRLFKFEEDKKYALLRIPLPSSIVFNIKRLSTTEAKKFCDKKSIFYSPNMRVLVFKDKEYEAYSVFKDLSITKNNLFRNLSTVVTSSDLSHSQINALVLYNALRLKLTFDFFDNHTRATLKFKRFSILSSSKTNTKFIGNSELSLFDF